MRHVGDKITADVLQPLHGGHVVQNDHRPALSRKIPQRRAPQADRPIAGAAEQEIILDRLAAVDRPQGKPPQIGVTDHLLQRAADGAIRVDGEQFRRRSVDSHDPLPGVDGEHALDHAAEHRLLLAALSADREPAFHELLAKRGDRVGEFGELRRLRGRNGSTCIAVGQPGCGQREIGHRSSQSVGNREAGGQSRRCPREEAEQQPSQGPRQLGVGVDRVCGDADDARGLASGTDGRGHDENAFAGSRIIAAGSGDPSGGSLLDKCISRRRTLSNDAARSGRGQHGSVRGEEVQAGPHAADHPPCGIGERGGIERVDAIGKDRGQPRRHVGHPLQLGGIGQPGQLHACQPEAADQACCDQRAEAREHMPDEPRAGHEKLRKSCEGLRTTRTDRKRLRTETRVTPGTGIPRHGRFRCRNRTRRVSCAGRRLGRPPSAPSQDNPPP